MLFGEARTSTAMTARLVTMDSAWNNNPPRVRSRAGVRAKGGSENASVDDTLVLRQETRGRIRSVWNEIKEHRRPGLRAIRDLARVARSGGAEAAEELLGLYLAEQSDAHRRTA